MKRREIIATVLVGLAILAFIVGGVSFLYWMNGESRETRNRIQEFNKRRQVVLCANCEDDSLVKLCVEDDWILDKIIERCMEEDDE